MNKHSLFGLMLLCVAILAAYGMIEAGTFAMEKENEILSVVSVSTVRHENDCGVHVETTLDRVVTWSVSFYNSQGTRYEKVVYIDGPSGYVDVICGRSVSVALRTAGSSLPAATVRIGKEEWDANEMRDHLIWERPQK